MPKIIEAKCILFDLDGTLIDSTKPVETFWLRWATLNNVDSVAVLSYVHGVRGDDVVRHFRPDLIENDPEYAVRLEQEHPTSLEGITILPGVEKLLKRLPEERWTIVTSCSIELAERRLNYLGMKAPKSYITADEIVNGKPHPEPYLKGAALMGFKPEDCLAIEDSPAGLRSASEAGAKTLAVLTSHSREKLEAVSPTAIAQDLEHVEFIVLEDKIRVVIP
ncbi:uncharacterized protein VTP21DRAFT_4631 [Calcarisporiella thermophila]|uniref:uncharacterized protein n=1 Tax=Calcarisporiella thermophila TaxID=911321 RepID=UPI003743F7D3